MTGQVDENNALLTVPILAPGQSPLALEFVIDTGFTGYLTLPEAAAVASAWTFCEGCRQTLPTTAPST